MRYKPLNHIFILILLSLFVDSPLSANSETSAADASKSDRSQKGERLNYNPSAGVDSDGRIPKVTLPDDIKNPSRWRYVPEGRIKPGNVFKRLLVSSFIFPVFFFEQDVGAGGGIALTDIDFRQKRRREFAGAFLTYTTEGQQRYSMIWQRWLHHRELENGGVAFGERSFIRASAGYSKTLTRRFYGLGPDTTADDETSYTDEVPGIRFTYQRSYPDPGDNLVYRLGLNAEYHNLSKGRVSDAPSTDESFPVLFQLGDNYEILRLSGLLRYDSRDSQHAPYKGGLIELAIDGVPLQGNDKMAAIVSLDANRIFEVPGIFHGGGDDDEEHPPTDSVAFDARLRLTGGELPYWALPSLGGRNTLRGYIGNRFTGKAAWHASAEYRLWLVPRGFRITDSIHVERLGTAFFYDIGTVEDNLKDLLSATIHDSYGISFRFSLERTALFRADIGFSDEGTNFTFAYGLSF